MGDTPPGVQPGSDLDTSHIVGLFRRSVRHRRHGSTYGMSWSKNGDDADGHATDASIFQDEWMHVWSLLESLCQICRRCCESAASSCCFCKETREITLTYLFEEPCKNYSSKPWFPMIAHGFLWNCRLQSVTRGLYPHIITISWWLISVHLHKSHQSSPHLIHIWSTKSHQSSPLDPHLIHIWSTFPRLLELGIKPIFVFDGEAPEMKSHARSSRAARAMGSTDPSPPNL